MTRAVIVHITTKMVKKQLILQKHDIVITAE